jgi:predicted TIM-barrel fold metal-dependent hydrolase
MLPVISEFILGGVLERHPRLRLLIVEAGAGWVPFFLEQTEFNFIRHRFWTQSNLKLLPSEYWKRQCFVSFQQDKYAIRNRDLIGKDALMWSSDYPHAGSDWPNSRTSINNQIESLPADEQRAIVCDNARAAYNLPLSLQGSVLRSDIVLPWLGSQVSPAVAAAP